MKKKKTTIVRRKNSRAEKISNEIPVSAPCVPTTGIGNGINPFSLPFMAPFGGEYGGEQISGAATGYVNLRGYLISNLRQFLSELYVEIGLVQTIVDVPVDDAFRGGIEIKSKQLSEEQIEELKNAIDRDNNLKTIAQGEKWNRLFGGAGIIILTDQDPEEPFYPDELNEGDYLDFRAVDMWELFWDRQYTPGYDSDIDDERDDFEFYTYYGEKIHKSRVMKLKGLVAPSFVRSKLNGWGFSVVEALIRSLNQYLKATSLSFEVLDEFKVDVYKIKNLVNTLMSPTGDQAVKRRIALANYQKNYQNAVVMDSEDDWDHKQLSFTGLAEAMEGIRMQVASDMRMPMIKLFGTPAKGLNADDEDSIEVYNSMVDSEIRSKIKQTIIKVCELKCQTLFGMFPDDLSIEFNPLRVLSAVDEENVKTQKFTRLLQAFQAQVITFEEFRDAANRENLFGISLATDLPFVGFVSQVQAGAAESDKESSEPDEAQSKKPESEITTEKERSVNSITFDKASYEADGGDAWIDPKRRDFFENPGNVDESLWSKAKEASKAAYGKVKWQFVVFMYKKWGGKF